MATGTSLFRGVRYAKSLSIQYFIDIDILKISLIGIDIFKKGHIDIDIFIDKRYGLSIYRTPLSLFQQMRRCRVKVLTRQTEGEASWIQGDWKREVCRLETKCDISVSKLLGFKTFPFSWFWVSYQKNLVSKKVLDSVSKKFDINKSIGFSIEKFGINKNVLDSVSFRFWVSSHTGWR